MKYVGFKYRTDYSRPRIEYVLDYINRHPLNGRIVLRPQLDLEKTISYGLDNTSKEWSVPRQGIIFSKQTYTNTELRINAYNNNDKEVYSIERVEKNKAEFLIGKTFQFDVIEAIFFHISRYEEYICKDNNEWDAMREHKQLLVINKLEKKPIVDHLVCAFINALTSAYQIKSTYTLTHDIDYIRKFKKPWDKIRKGLGFIKRGEFFALRNYQNQLKKVNALGLDPYDVFEEILSDRNIEKEIYYLVGGKHKFDTPINTEDDIFKKSVTVAKERGYAIGIHPSYECWKNPEMMEREKKKLENAISQKVKLSRQHYLHFNFPKTISVLEKVGITKDSSLGFNRRIGFRCGTGFPFRLFVLGEERVSSVIEQPLIYMDSSIMKESNEEKKQILEGTNSFILDNKHDTHITFNFHNSRFEESELKQLGLRNIYENLFGV